MREDQSPTWLHPGKAGIEFRELDDAQALGNLTRREGKDEVTEIVVEVVECRPRAPQVVSEGKIYAVSPFRIQCGIANLKGQIAKMGAKIIQLLQCRRPIRVVVVR